MQASKNDNTFMVRMPEGLRDKLKALAEANNRSMNSELVLALEKHLGASASAMEANVSELNDKLSTVLRWLEAIQKAGLLK